MLTRNEYGLSAKAVKTEGLKELHERFGHVNVETLKRMVKGGYFENVKIDSQNSFE